jgi:succinate-semialdehyde dehydrogenase/glutarate-semialdehyde dehydrogenase
MRSINPATGETIREYPEHDPAEIERRLQQSRDARQIWRRTDFAQRANLLRQAAAVLRARSAEFSRLMTLEMGKLLTAAEAEVEKCAVTCDWCADHAERHLAPEPATSDASRSFVRFDPLGTVLAVMPWNFPFWQAIRCATPAIAAGNTVVLKHASNVPGCALALEELFRVAGFPPGVFTTLLVSSAAVPDLIAHATISAVSLTGSEAAGLDVARHAAAALKKSVLELGGSDPFLVLADADPDATAREATSARIINNGQSCIAAKRFIVEAAIAEPFERAFAERVRALRLGDPMARETEVGPLAREDLIATLDDQVKRSVAGGATLAVGGRRRAGPGFFYEPTLLTGVEPGMAAFDEETFGPVAAVTRARDADHAIELANRSRFGLGASIWTKDPSRGEALAARIEAGSVFVNGPVKSDARLPFGGVKHSGWGRELSAFGLREFVNVKTVWVR